MNEIGLSNIGGVVPTGGYPGSREKISILSTTNPTGISLRSNPALAMSGRRVVD